MATLPPLKTGTDPYLGAPLAENPYIGQAITPGAPILPSRYETAYEQQNAPQPDVPAAHPVPASDKGPAPDPYAGAPVLAEDPYAGAPAVTDVRGYDMAKLSATPLDKLLKDKAEFNPVEFYAKNTDALLADPKALEKVEAVFDARDKERMTPGQLAKKIATAPLTIPYNIVAHPIESAKTGAKIVKGGVEFVGDLLSGAHQVVKTGAEVAGNLSEGDTKGAAKGISEGVSAVDSAIQKWVTLITDKVGPSLGVIPRGSTPRERLAYDAEFKKAEMRAAEGNGELAKNLGTSQEELKASGVTLDPKAIEKMSVVTDPFFLVPVGGAIGVVGRGGKFLLGRATSPALAEAFTKGINAAMEKAAAWPVSKVGEGLSKAGEVLETKGPAIVPRGAKGYSAIHAAMTGDITPLAASLVAPKAIEVGGKVLGAVGRGLEAAAPAAGHIAAEGIKGTAEGAVLSLPFYLGATPEEREGLPGMAFGGGLIRAGFAGAGLGAHSAERKIQEARAAKIFEAADRGPVKDSPYYGTDGALDEAHAAKTATMTPREQSVVSWARETFRPAGIEVYALDKDTFKNHVPNVAGAEAAPGFFLKRGERIGPDGSSQPVMQILLNTDTSALGHELYHAFKSLDPQGSQALEAHISKTWTPEEQAWIADTYNAALNGGKPRSQWTQEYDRQQILEEAAAEVFGRVLDSTDLSGVQPSIIKRAVDFASRALEKVGNPIAGKGLGKGPGVSELGVRPSHAEVDISRDFLHDITRRVKDGSLGPAKPVKPGTQKRPGGSRTSQGPAQPLSPSDVGPAPAGPKPAPAPVAPVAPVATVPERPPTPRAPAPPAPEAPNIRVTPKEQADFAAERAKVTNADQAVAAAEKSGDPQQVAHVQTINDALAAGHAVEIVHKGVIREGGPTPEAPVKRGTRRAEQEEAYVAEAMGAVPDDIRELHQKTFFPTRWLKAGKQLTARSLDKVLANIKNAVDMSSGKVTLPYEVDATGKLTPGGWSEVVQDLKDYWTNQDRGFRGDGAALSPETRTRDIGQSLPPEDPRGPAATISPERTDFLNLVQGLNIPAAVTRQIKGKVPGNIKGQLLAEAQGKRPAKPAAIRPEDVGRQTYKPIEGIGVRSIAEVNPLRNDLRAAGAPVENLIEVTENINRENIVSVTPRPDMPGRGGSTDITRGGFSVKGGDIVDQSGHLVTPELYRDVWKNSVNPFFKGVSYDDMMSEIQKVQRGEQPGNTFTTDGKVYTPPAGSKLDVVPLTSENIPAEKMNPLVLREFLGRYPEAAKNPDVVVGLFKLPSGEISADLNVLVDQAHRKQSIAFAKSHDQHSIYDLAKNEVIPVGGTGESVPLSPKGVVAALDMFPRTQPEAPGSFSVKNVDEAAQLLDKTPADWAETTRGFKGGLTQEAYRLGLSLTDRADLNRLSELSAKAQEQFKSTMAEGDMDGAMAQATKAQFYREAWEAAQGIRSAKGGLQRFAKDEGIEPKPPFPVAEGDSFSPATAKGKELEKDGYDFRVTGELGNRTVNVFKDGLPIGYASSRQIDPKSAELSMVNVQKEARGKGVGEAIYRELMSQLQKDGVELVEGMVVAPQPLALRNKIFGGRFEKLEAGGEPISLNDALTGANLIKKGVSSVPFPGIDVVNRIHPEDKFSVKSVPTDKEITAALSEDKKPFVGAHRDLEPGTPVGLRIDIPAYTRHGTYVVTVHEKAKGGAVGKRIGYDSVATVDNPTFFSNEKGAQKIKEGAAKFPIATVEGEYNPSRSIPQNLKGWTEVGYNPTKHSYFYDKATDEPVVSGSQAVSAGNSVFVKDAKFGNKEDFAFSPARDAGAETGKQKEAREAWVKQGTESPYFQRWFKGSKVVDPYRPSDPQLVYHGTTHEFSTFEKRGANPENQFGEGFYFSSDPDEVGRNYAGEGPDLTQRIEQRADRLENEDLSREEALQQAREEIKGTHGGAMMPAYLNIKNPFRLGDKVSGTPETRLTFNPDTEKGTLTKFLDALVEEARQADETKPEELRQEVLEAVDYDSISATKLDKVLRRSENLAYATDENGTLMSSEIYRRALEKAGFDGIIDETVSDKFKNMKLAPDTIHYTAFKPEQVKSATGNAGTFSKSNPDVRFSVKGPEGITPEEVKPKKAKAPKAPKAPKVEKEPEVTPETAEAAVEKINREMNILFPEAKPLRYVREDDGTLKIEKGKLVPADEEARLQETPLAKDAIAANPDKAPDEAISDALSDKIVDEAKEVLKHPDVAKGLTWYDDAVKLIKKYYGEHAEKFAQLLAATSPRNGVQVNFAYAVEAFNNFMAGKYDRNVSEYLKIRDEWAKGEGENLEQWKQEKGKKWKAGDSNVAVALRNNFLSWAVDKHNLLPLREGVIKKSTGELTGTLYGMHTFAVLDVLANTWLQDVEGPKVRNFLANLTGTGHEATIDIWATRFLMRLSQSAESLKGKWRVSPPAGEGISNENFAMAQKAFRKAAEKMGVTPDALQALVWFSEKHMWEENNWTGFSGAAKSDYAYWLRGLEPGEVPGTHVIPQKLKEEATLQGQQERAKAEERRKAREKLLSSAGLKPVVE